jgi:hypothetical protein
MTFRSLGFAICLSLGAAGCASGYVDADASWTGGFGVEKVSDTRWVVSYSGNGYTTHDTVMTYWLYRASELAIAQGYDGFAVAFKSGSDTLDKLIDEGWSGKPGLYASVRLLKAPIEEKPGVNFEAKALKAFLEPYVNGKKCSGNVCPHVREYLYPGFGKPAAAPAGN